MTVFVLIAIACAVAFFLRPKARKVEAGQTQNITRSPDIVRAAFKQRAGTHPVDCVEDPALIASGLLVARLKQDLNWSQATSNAVYSQIRKHFDIGLKEAEEVVLFGHWITEQGDADEILQRLMRRTKQVGGDALILDCDNAIRTICGRDKRGQYGAMARQNTAPV